ncbi:alpha/beta fold hydrolase [Pseudoduganella plicata]|uniref:Alpha/beta hydrolase n=1 Tax=Pseudoduganella plicata TaxID=321984 RepID=A0A4P7BAA7_9BURK|nr:alpha/beta hydrolase [Pseudoduganella plicata]QBQ35501.1 alpha/beta hydrolase [Pseudoduganella plicata]GGY97408.1 alpha/beta hydrolase [Pseudoduganella plicata]
MNVHTRLRALAAAAVFATLGAHAHAADAGPSVVIVHGAFADGSDWARVIPLLQAKGVKVTAVQNPLTSLADDVAATRRAIDSQPGKVVLVGHSWGGTVITEAGQHDKVGSLVYVAAFAPEAGKSTAETGEGYPAAPGSKRFVADREGYLTLPEAAMREDFAQDVPAVQAAVMTATQGPIQSKAFADKVTVAAWKTRASWFIVSNRDRMIDPGLQRAMAKKIGARTTELAASHVPQQSRPADVAKVILDAVAATRQGS